MKHTYREITKPENGFDQDDQVRRIIMGRYYEECKGQNAVKQEVLARVARLRECKGGLDAAGGFNKNFCNKFKINKTFKKSVKK